MSNWVEMATIAFIVIGIFTAIWRGGAANPEGTRTLSKGLGQLSGRVGELDQRVGHVEEELDQLQATAATGKDIQRLEERIATVRAEMQGHSELAKRTHASVKRIEDHLIDKGFGR